MYSMWRNKALIYFSGLDYCSPKAMMLDVSLLSYVVYVIIERREINK